MTQTGPLQVPQLPTALSPVYEMSRVFRVPTLPGYMSDTDGAKSHLWGQLCSPHPKIPLEVGNEGMWCQDVATGVRGGYTGSSSTAFSGKSEDGVGCEQGGGEAQRGCSH